MGAGDEEHISRRGGSDVWNPNLRSELAEITFGQEPPTEAMKAFYSTKIPIPASMRRSDAGYSPERSLMGAVVFGEGDAAKFGGRLGQARPPRRFDGGGGSDPASDALLSLLAQTL